MELHQLKYFVAVAEEGGFCKGATRCGLAQPSLSQQVRKLEESLGCQLFDRLGRRTILTDEGAALLPRAKKLLAEVQDLQRAATAREAGPGRIAIGAIPTIAPYALPKLVKELRRARPGCDISIREDVTDNLTRALVNAELDICLVGLPIDHEHIETQSLGTEPMLLALPKDHRWASRDSVPLAQLDNEPMILLHEEHCFGRRLASLCAGARVRPRVTSMSAHLHTALALVASGQGITVVPSLCAKGTRSHGITFVRLAGHSSIRELALAWRKGRTLSATALDLAKIAEKSLAEDLRS